MKTPFYETSGGALMALLLPGTKTPRQLALADCYEFTLASGPVLRYTDADRDITFSGKTFSGKTVRFDDPGNKAAVAWKSGSDVMTWQVYVFPRPQDVLTGAPYPDTIGSQPFIAACVGGALDGAQVTIYRAYFPDFPPASAAAMAPTGAFIVFSGRVAAVDMGRSGMALTFNSWTDVLSLNMPRNLFQLPCRYTLFDAGCTLSAAAFAVTGSVSAVTSGAIFSSAIAAPGGSATYALGRILMTSGNNNGFGRMVRSWAGGVFTLVAPFYFALAPGDTFTAYPGCDKTIAQCTAFGNFQNYGGDAFTPEPEAAV